MEKIKVKMKVENNDDILFELKKKYESCPKAIRYIKSLNIPDSLVDENIIKVNDMVSDINYCSKCPGLEKCGKENPHLVTRIIYSQGVLDREIRPCKKYVERMEFENQFIVKDMDREVMLANNVFMDSKKNQQSQSAILFKKMSEIKKYNWYYLYGSDKKTVSSNAFSLVVELIKQDLGPVAFLNSPNRIRDLNALSFEKSPEGKVKFQKTLDLYFNAPILVFDDFGNEYITDYIRDTIIFPIINTRATKRLPTIFASYFSLDEIKKLYTTSNGNDIRAGQIVRQIRLLSEIEFNLDESSK